MGRGNTRLKLVMLREIVLLIPIKSQYPFPNPRLAAIISAIPEKPELPALKTAALQFAATAFVNLREAKHQHLVLLIAAVAAAAHVAVLKVRL